MHSHPGPIAERHPDWAKIARLECELYGQTFHHDAPGCDCSECMKRRAEWDQQLHEQTVQGWEMRHGS
jgi:hypothetical protein